MKNQLQKELLEKVREGVKPSQLRKSKSLGDIPPAPPLPKTLVKSKSAQELETKPTREELETKISVLELKLETQSRELVEHQAEQQILTDQLKEKQNQVEKLKEQLETKVSPTELDQSLIARHKNLKDWFQAHQKTQNLDQELSENIDQASTELINQDQRIANLRSENFKLKAQNQSLTKDLELTQKLAQLRTWNERATGSLTKEPLFTSDWPTFPWSLAYLVLALVFWFLMKPNV